MTEGILGRSLDEVFFFKDRKKIILWATKEVAIAKLFAIAQDHPRGLRVKCTPVKSELTDSASFHYAFYFKSKGQRWTIYVKDVKDVKDVKTVSTMDVSTDVSTVF